MMIIIEMVEIIKKLKLYMANVKLNYILNTYLICIYI